MNADVDVKAARALTLSIFGAASRQWRIFLGLLRLKTVREIAAENNVTPHNVHCHRSLIHAKVGVESGAALIAWAVAHGIVRYTDALPPPDYEYSFAKRWKAGDEALKMKEGGAQIDAIRSALGYSSRATAYQAIRAAKVRRRVRDARG